MPKQTETTALIVEWIKYSVNNQTDDDGNDMYSVDEDIDVREQIISMIEAAQEMAKALEYAVDKIAPCSYDECKAVDGLTKSYAAWKEVGGE